MRRWHSAAGLVAALIAVGGTEAQGGGNPVEERFAVSLGTFFMTSDTRIRADRFDGVTIGTTIDFEDTFGFDEETVFRADVMWRMTPRNKLRLMYFDSERRAIDTTEFEIRFGDEVFPADVEVIADFDFDILELAYEYAFLRSERYEMGASLGVHNVGLKLGLSATLSSPGGGGSVERAEQIETDAPLPVVGLRGTWRIAGDFYARAHAQYFKLKFGDYDGNIQDYEVGVLWQFSKHLGVGASYNLFRTTVDSSDEGNFEGQLRWKYDGAQLFVRAAL